MRRIAPVLLLALLAVGTASADLPKAARFELDGVPYAYVAGVNGTATFVVNGGAPMPVDACAFVMLHEGTTFGRVQVRGLQMGGIPFSMFIDQFRLDNGSRGYTYDKPVVEDGLARIASLAIGGNGSLRVASDRYYDPVSSSGVDLIDKDQPDLVGSLAVLPSGVRDDLTGEVLAGAAAKGDEELHLHLRSAPDAAGHDIVYTYSSPGPGRPSGLPPEAPWIPPGTTPILPTEAYGALYWLPNLKIGGNGTVRIEASSSAPPGENNIELHVISPLGVEVAATTVTPGLLADDSGEATFPLDLFGDYALMLTGQVSLATYTITVTLSPAEAVDMHLWFEEVSYGEQAYQDLQACEGNIQSPDQVLAVESVVSRPDPPQMDLALVGIGITGALLAVSIGVKLAADQLSMSSFRKGK